MATIKVPNMTARSSAALNATNDFFYLSTTTTDERLNAGLLRDYAMAGVAAGTGITEATGEVYKSWVERYGNVIKTSILIDITGLRHSAAGDIIGDDGTSEHCHLGEITDALNGIIFAGRMTCFEAPTVLDLDLYQASVGTGIEDAAISGVVGQTELINSGNWVLGDVKLMTQANLPDDTDFLYLVCQSAGDADYAAGKFLIELWGTV